jgi:hypothetical protein
MPKYLLALVNQSLVPEKYNKQQGVKELFPCPTPYTHPWTLSPTGLFLIQVDISGHPPFPTGSKQFSGNFGNLLFLAGFNFRGHFEGLNEGFLRSRFSMIAKGMIEPPK